MKKIRTPILLLTVLLLLPLALSSCSQGGVDAQDLCTEMVEATLANNFDAAYALCDEVCTKDEFRPLWEEMRGTLKNADSYELEHVGWNVHKNAGEPSYTSNTFELTTDNGKTCYLEVITTSDVNGMAGLYFLDSTEFLENTSFVPWLNILPILASLASIGFCIWMLIDCAKRRIKAKLGWIILIFAGVSLSLAIGASELDFDFSLGLFLAFSYISRDAAALAINIRLLLPVGAIVYCCLRNRITLQDPPAEAAPTAEQPLENVTPETAPVQTEDRPDPPSTDT